jgi:hypothetical protein
VSSSLTMSSTAVAINSAGAVRANSNAAASS